MCSSARRSLTVAVGAQPASCRAPAGQVSLDGGAGPPACPVGGKQRGRVPSPGPSACPGPGHELPLGLVSSEHLLRAPLPAAGCQDLRVLPAAGLEGPGVPRPAQMEAGLGARGARVGPMQARSPGGWGTGDLDANSVGWGTGQKVPSSQSSSRCWEQRGNNPRDRPLDAPVRSPTDGPISQHLKPRH